MLYVKTLQDGEDGEGSDDKEEEEKDEEEEEEDEEEVVDPEDEDDDEEDEDFDPDVHEIRPLPPWKAYLTELEASLDENVVSELKTAREMVWETISTQVADCQPKQCAQKHIDNFVLKQQPRYSSIILSKLIPASYGSRLELCGLNPKIFKPQRVELCSVCKDYFFDGVTSNCQRPHCKGTALLGTANSKKAILFAYFPLEEQLKRISENAFLAEQKNYLKNKFLERYTRQDDNVLDIPDATQSTYMDDVDDGAKVRGLVLKHGIDILDAFLLSLTTDGIALSKHANNSVIPLVVRVLNFPPYLRAKYVSLAIIACSKPSSQIMKYQVLS